MKKIIILLSAIFLLSSCAQTRTTYDTLSQTEDLSKSIQTYVSSDSLDCVDGVDFQGKLTAIAKVANAQYHYYYYDILIAPRTSRVKQIDSISFLPDEQLQEYLSNDDLSASGIKEWNTVFQDVDYPVISSHDDYTAYHFTFVFHNRGNDAQNKADISEEVFDAYMKHCIVEIDYNGDSSEQLHLYSDQLPTYKSDINTPDQLKPLLKDETIPTGMNPL